VEDLGIESLQVRGMRNLGSVDLVPCPRFNVVWGDNGHGKTNLLEAIYVLATTRSFRTGRLADLVMHGGEVASVRARIREGTAAREQSVGVRAGARMVRVDGKRPATLAAYAVRTPVVVFHPGVVALSMGSGGERRRLLDRVALYLEPASLDAVESYTRALRERQRALQVRGTGARDLDEWEELVVRHGLIVTAARRRAAEMLAQAAAEAFERIAPPGTRLEATYDATAPENAEAYRRALAESRDRDVRRGSASLGPHRDDLTLVLGEHPARNVASQGQHRAIVLSLKLAEIAVVRAARGLRPILLLDDVSSELDRGRAAALFTLLQQERGQVFLTTTRPELIDTGPWKGGGERREFSVVDGVIRARLEGSP
jgi:DNA replication and repair protein RecF